MIFLDLCIDIIKRFNRNKLRIKKIKKFLANYETVYDRLYLLNMCIHSPHMPHMYRHL